MPARRGRRAFTLIELTIVIALLGVLASVATLAVRRVPPPPYDPARVIEDSVRVAVGERRTIAIVVQVGGEVAWATANADGSVIVDSALALDRLSGRAHVR
jgi:prepilin-type N-terminal cleavage/methylation domain-containing protein